MLRRRGRLGVHPVGWRSEIHSPKMRRRRKEFHADALAFFHVIADEDHAAFLFFLSERIRQHDDRADGQLGFQIKQCTVSVDHNCLAGFAELAAHGVLAFRGNTDALEYARTASGSF